VESGFEIIMEHTTTGSTGYCGPNGHYFIWSCPNTGKAPEGLTCSCGQFTAHWEECYVCGESKLVLKALWEAGVDAGGKKRRVK